MQVRKFEAKSMKDALSMVKRELGPEAIILSAKDNSQSFGLMGGSSVEITAAVSETVLRKKQLAEKKMRENDLETFRDSSAAQQKKFINKVYDRAVSKSKTKVKPPVTTRRYIEIADEPVASVAAQAIAPAAMSTGAFDLVGEQNTQPLINPPVSSQRPEQNSNSVREVSTLKSEITRLKGVIADFQKMPQSFITVHPGAEKGVSYEFSSIFKKLDSVGVDEEIALQLIDKAKKQLSSEAQRKKSVIDAWMAREILTTTRVCEEPMAGLVHTFIGASGQGKTSSLVKMAGELVVNQGKKIALITADTMKIGASEQLKIFAQILNVPFAAVKGPEDWKHIMRELGGVDHLLLDFPAVQFKDIKDIDFARRLLPPDDVDRRTHLVVSATSKNKDVDEMARGFRILNFDDVIFTKLDESMNHGQVYNFQKKFSTPIHSFGTGPRIPEDFEVATKERVLDLLFRLTKLNVERGNQ